MKVSLKLFRRSGVTKPSVWIGKGGVTKTVLDQIKVQLKATELVKVKIQKTALSTESIKEVAEEVARDTSSTLVDTRGRTFTLYKRAPKP
jgi:RNA-binding protein